MNQNNLLALWDYSTEEIKSILDLSTSEKLRFKKEGSNDFLKGKTALLLFEKPSLRTRITFEVAMNQCGGSCMELQPEMIFGKRESLEDAIKNLSLWVDVLVVRTFSQKIVEEMSKYSKVSIINALTDNYHPCQAFAFIQTLQEKRGDVKGLNLTFLGDQNNMSNSLAIMATKMGMNFTLACPSNQVINSDFSEKIKNLCQENQTEYKIEHSPTIAVEDASVLYTDVWVSMGQEKQDFSPFEPFQINDALLKKAPKDVLISHCLPAHRGEEISKEAMDLESNICFLEAENRLHTQKGILLALLNSQ